MLIGGVFYSAFTSAQESPIGWKDFSYIQQSEAWLSTDNAAGLKYLPVNNISTANIHIEKRNGKFVNYYESDNSLNSGGNAESYYRLDPKIVFYGKVSYNYFTGKNMGGSAFIDPYYNPFDIVQYSDSTRGKKNKETYNLAGAVSVDIYKGLSLGAKFDYTAANYAKTKDLRHTNKLMDMYLTVGANYEISRRVGVGLNYYHRRSTEDLEFNVYGTQDIKYQSLISYGAFFGKSETFGENGYTSDKKPMFNQFNGVALQLNYKLSNKIDLFSEIGYKSRDGYYGLKSSKKIRYSEHNSDIIEYKGIFSYSNKNYKHILRADISNEKLVNNETVYRSENQGGGTTIIVYYDPLKVLSRNTSHVKLEYTGNLGIEDFNPKWTLNAGMEYLHKKQTAYLYPFYRKQTIEQTVFNLSAKRNVIKGLNMYTVVLGAVYSTGKGMPQYEGLYVAPSEGQAVPQVLDQYLNREYEYLTNNQWKGNIGFQYSRLFKDLRGYVSVNYSSTKASNVKYLNGDNLNELYFAVGCTF